MVMSETSRWFRAQSPLPRAVGTGMMLLPPGDAAPCATRPGPGRGDKGAFEGPGGAGRAWAAPEMCEIWLWPGSFLERNCSQRNRPNHPP